MSLHDQTLLSGRLAALISVVPIVLGVPGWHARAPAFRWLWGWLAFGVALNGVMWVIGVRGIGTAMVVQLSYPAFLVLGLTTMAALSGSQRVARWCRVAGAAYLPFWAWRMLEREAAGAFSVYTGPVLWMLLTVGAMVLLITRLRVLTVSPLRDPTMMVGMGALVSYAPAAALEPVSAALYASHRDLTLVLWIVRSGLLILGSLLFTLAFLWTHPSHPSRGSTSSAAPASG